MTNIWNRHRSMWTGPNFLMFFIFLSHVIHIYFICVSYIWAWDPSPGLKWRPGYAYIRYCRRKLKSKWNVALVCIGLHWLHSLHWLYWLLLLHWCCIGLHWFALVGLGTRARARAFTRWEFIGPSLLIGLHWFHWFGVLDTKHSSED